MNDDLLCRWGLVVDERNLPVFWRLGSPKIAECWRHVDLPADDQIMIDHVRVTEAAGSVVTLDTITAVANRIGDMAKGLNRDRLRYLIKGGKVRACRQDPPHWHEVLPAR
ncbi:hypothetical protein [Mycobacteroides abscessus]|uniref:hypothetical protein n=1 Tax=Mycobacteroides abscessus TaxID=36809 RepID=UPI001F1F6E29|nr:hypothetical protein [Mycobacteroides abscessus]